MSTGPRQSRTGTRGTTSDGTAQPRKTDTQKPNGTHPQPANENGKIRTRHERTTGPLAHDGHGLVDGHDGISADLTDVPLVAGVPLIQPEELTPEQAIRHKRARRHAFMVAGSFLLVLILVVETIVLSPWSDPVAGQPPHQLSATALSDVDPYGVNVFLHKEVDQWKREKTLDMASQLGAGWIKQQFPWAEIEFSKDNYYDSKNNQSAWAKFDSIVDLAEQRGLRIIARIDSTPEWAKLDDDMPEADKEKARADKDYAKFPPSPGHIADFNRFINTFVQHYKGRIAALQIWNEPNLKSEWGSGIDAQGYVNLLYNAYLSAKQADPNIIVLAAPLATTITRAGQVVNGNLNEMDYLQAMYYAAKQMGIAPPFDAMSANAYGKGLPPEDPPSWDKLNFRRVELLRRVMDNNGDRNKAIWFNEYGWNASPDNLPTPTAQGQVTFPWDKVTPEQQAQYTVEGIKYAEEHWPWAGVFTIWYLRQVGDIPQTSSEYYFSMVNPEFVPNPVYTAVQSAASEDSQVATPGEWSPLSTPIHAGPLWNIKLSAGAPNGSYVAPSSATIQDNSAINFTFQGTDVSLKLVPPAQPLTGTVAARYYVALDGSSRNVDQGLPRDPQGRAYIDLPGSGQATEVKIASGVGVQMPMSKHTITISVLPVSNGETNTGAGHVAAPPLEGEQPNLPGIAAIEVEANRSYLLFGLLTLILAAGIVLLLLTLRRDSRTARVGGAQAR